MTNPSTRNAIIIAAALAATIPSLAFAQTQPAPPIYYSVDRNGVDMVTGEFHPVTSEVAIGPVGNGGLTYGRVALNGGWRDLTIGGLNCVVDDCVVSLGSTSEAFTRFGSTPPYLIFQPVSNEGASLDFISGAYRYTGSDGTVAWLTPVAGANPYTANTALLTSVTEPSGLKLTYHYNTVGSDQILQSITNNLGYQMHYRYDGVSTTFADKIMGINMAQAYCSPTAANCDHLSGWPSVTYALYTDGSGGINEYATDQSGRQTLYHRDPTNTLDAIRLPGQSGYQIAVLRNGDRQVTQASGPSGVWTYGYFTSGPSREVQSSGPSGQSIIVDSDLTVGRPNLYRVISETSPYVRLSDYRFGYDGQSRLTSMEMPDGNSVSYILDARGNSTKTNFLSKDGLSTITNSATYPCVSGPITCNRPATTTDGRGQVTNYTWSTSHGRLEAVELPAPSTSSARPETRYNYGSLNAAYLVSPTLVAVDTNPVVLPTAVSACTSGDDTTCLGTSSEILTTMAYDTSGAPTNLQPTSTTTGAAAGQPRATTSFAYNEDGDVASVTGPVSGESTVYIYDDARQQVGVVSPDPDGSGPLLNRAQRVTYSLRGQPTLIEAGTTTGQTPGNWSSFVTLQRQLTAYDDFGKPTEERAQSAGGVTRTLQQVSYDVSGRVWCTAIRMNPNSYASPPASACTAAAPGAYGPDRIAQTIYDLADQPRSTTTGLGTSAAQTESVTYTLNGKPETLVDGRGSTSLIEYDGFDRMGRMAYPDPTTGVPSTTDDEVYGYGLNSNVTTFTNRAGQSFITAYDFLNRPTAVTAPVGTPSSSYVYDNLSRSTVVAVPGIVTTMVWDGLGRMVSETGPAGTMSYGYDLAGRQTSQIWPDAFATGYSWSTVGQMVAITAPTGTIVSYSYDNSGRRSSVTRSNGVGTAYSYDDISRLTALNHLGSTNVSLGFSFNPANQIISRTMSNSAYAYAGPSGATSFTLDRLNRISSANSVPFSYDGNSNLTNDGTRTYAYDAASRLTGGGSPTGALSYDGFGRLDTLTGAFGGRYLYSGIEAAALADPSTNVIANHFVRGSGINEIVANYPTGGSPLFWMLDERNSVMALSDTSGGTPYNDGFDEYGNPRSGNVGRFQYTGQLLMRDFGAYHYQARAYSPGLGRFLQADPGGYGDGTNLYAYVGNDPVNLVDPSGRVGELITRDRCGVLGGTIVQRTAGQQYDQCVITTTFTVFWSGSGSGGVSAGGGQGGSETCSRSRRDQSIPAQFGGFGLGLGDAFSFGAWSAAWTSLPDPLGDIYERDIGNYGYNTGLAVGTVGSAGRLAYAGVASTFSGMGGAAAVSARNNLKGMFSGLGARHPRAYTYEQMLGKYGSDRAVASAASRTNSRLNNAAGLGAASGPSEMLGCS